MNEILEIYKGNVAITSYLWQYVLYIPWKFVVDIKVLGSFLFYFTD